MTEQRKGNGRDPANARANGDEPQDRNPPGTTKGRTPDYIVEQRVRRVQFWMQQGNRTSAIYRLAARAHGEELAARAAAKKARKSADEYPPLVWAVDETPVGDRMVDTYISRAKALFEEEGRQQTKEVATQFGVIIARLNDLYARALNGKNILAAERLLKLQVEIFGIIGSIRPNWEGPGSGPGGEQPEPVAAVPETTTTEAQSEYELRSMVDVVLKRMGRDPADIKWQPEPGTSGPGTGKGGALTKGNGGGVN